MSDFVAIGYQPYDDPKLFEMAEYSQAYRTDDGRRIGRQVPGKQRKLVDHLITSPGLRFWGFFCYTQHKMLCHYLNEKGVNLCRNK